MPLQEMIYDIGGGIQDNRLLKAVQTGGPSGGCIPADLMDTPMEYDSLAKLGSIMGSGGMIVMDQATCMVDLAKYFITFTMEESCGKCTPCREGTQRLLEILTNITEGKGRPADLGDLEELSDYIKEVSLCGLGGTAPNPVLTTLNYFREEYLAHIVDKQCPARVCKRLSPTPCQFACPAGIDIPSYVALIAQGQYEEALELIREDNPLPSVCGYVCTAPCEVQCKRGVIDKPIAIKSLKRFVSDFVRQNGSTWPEEASSTTGQGGHYRFRSGRLERCLLPGPGRLSGNGVRSVARGGGHVTGGHSGISPPPGSPGFRSVRPLLNWGWSLKPTPDWDETSFWTVYRSKGIKPFSCPRGHTILPDWILTAKICPGLCPGWIFCGRSRTGEPPAPGQTAGDHRRRQRGC